MDPVLITAARTSRTDAIRAKQRHYLVTMAFRTVSFVLAIVLFVNGFKWAAIGLIVISLLVPLVAVVIANDSARPAGGDPDFYDAATDTRVQLGDRHPAGDQPTGARASKP